MSGRVVIHLRLCSGFPLDHMRDASGLKQALLRQHLIKTDASEVIANVTEMMVMPQPYGNAYTMMLTEQGEINVYHTDMRTGVLDVGRHHP